MVEFAIVATLLFTLVLGIMEYGLMMKTYLGLSQVAREGARTASVGKSTSDISAKISTWATDLGLTGTLTPVLERRAAGASPTSWGPLGDDTSVTPNVNSAQSGDDVRVTLTYVYTKPTGGFFGSNTSTLSTSVVMRRE